MSEKNQNSDLSISAKDLEKQILSRNPKLFEDLSDKKKEDVLKSLKEVLYVERSQEITRIRVAPLPTPEDLRSYHEIKQEYADIIVRMADEDQKHLHSRDNKIIDKSFYVKIKGQNYALLIAIIALSGGIICILFNYEISGTMLSGVGLTGLISEFLEKTFFEKLKKRTRR